MDEAVGLGGRWRLWDQFALRGAGFPAGGVLRLAPDGLAEAADKVEAAPGPDWTALVAHYWQRFCVKNDTIGFFGPVGWGRWDLSTEGLAIDPGRGMLAGSEVYFASWAIDTLAATIADDPAAKQWVAPRRVPFVRRDGDAVIVPGRPPQPVTADQAAVLDLCDGLRSARDVQAGLPGIDVPAVLADLVRRRWAVWRLEIPADARPERGLRAWLDRVGDPDLRQRGLVALDTLERGRDVVRAATGADELVAAMADLESTFVALTGTAGVREKSAGTAPCRALVYADCRRAATARTGGRVLDALAPLEPLLASAGWLTSRLAEAVMAKARTVYDGLAARGPVNLAEFWFACMPILHGDAVRETEELRREFQRRWQAILEPGPDTDRVHRTLAEVASGVSVHFGHAGGGWTAARYMSPDIMIAAASAEAVDRGDFQLALGELHLASNTIGASLFVNQHPAPGELADLTTRDHPGARLMPLLPKEHRSRLSARIRHCLVRPEDYYLALLDSTADPARPRTIRSADVTVVDDGGSLAVVLPDGVRFPAVEVFAHVLTTLAMDLFQVLPDADHTPRVTVDRMVVARETWRTAAADAGFAAEKDEARRFVLARRWRDGLRMPRFVFVVSPTEPRPFYVDFDSPVYVTILAKAIRRLARKDPEGALTITEMLPTPEQTWLTDDGGETYTAELRFVAVDES
ncbi:lantibiotic dehydratase [Saccharothrix sp. NRRL B-16314]|uniref:lantibiotic dehydratase n=1 Tax=Saccharothrix sp. NRRL B-16314 TaxID=1463825 RepID=UPI00052652EC|nr:lantibiotic dehydratase [Saccharothrix sp. NRRL B-16314]